MILSWEDEAKDDCMTSIESKLVYRVDMRVTRDESYFIVFHIQGANEPTFRKYTLLRRMKRDYRTLLSHIDNFDVDPGKSWKRINTCEREYDTEFEGDL
jgi:hypothetical protein